MTNDRLYILLYTVDGKAERVAEVLRGSPGVIMVDVLEGPPDLIIMAEAAGREQLAKLTIKALTSVETMTEYFRLLPARDGLSVGTFSGSS